MELQGKSKNISRIFPDVIWFRVEIDYPELTAGAEAGCGVSEFSLLPIFLCKIKASSKNPQEGLALALTRGIIGVAAVMGEYLVEFLAFFRQRAAQGPPG
jgi:hypothetical protein